MSYLFRLLMVWLMLGCGSAVAAQTVLFLAESLPPYHYVDSRGEPTGALVEVVRAMDEQTDINIEIELLPFARGYQMMQRDPSVFMFSLLKTPERTPQFQWLGETYRISAYLVGLKSRPDLKVASLKEAQSRVVGTIRGYYADSYLRQAGFTTGKNLSLSVKYERMWQMLFKGRIDYVFTNNTALQWEIGSLNLDANKVTQYLAVEAFPDELHVATNLKTSAKTVNELKRALEKIKTNGRYRQILKQWQL